MSFEIQDVHIQPSCISISCARKRKEVSLRYASEDATHLLSRHWEIKQNYFNHNGEVTIWTHPWVISYSVQTLQLRSPTNRAPSGGFSSSGGKRGALAFSLLVPSHPGTRIHVSPATSFKASTDEASSHVWGALVTEAAFSGQAHADNGGTTEALGTLLGESPNKNSLFPHSAQATLHCVKHQSGHFGCQGMLILYIYSFCWYRQVYIDPVLFKNESRKEGLGETWNKGEETPSWRLKWRARLRK